MHLAGPKTHPLACPLPGGGGWVCVARGLYMSYDTPCPRVVEPGTLPMQPCSSFAHVKSVIELSTWTYNGEFGRVSVCKPGFAVNAVNVKAAPSAG